MIETIRDLQERSAQLKVAAKTFDQAVAALQNVCKHDWTEQGYDPRGNGTLFYKCSQCDSEKTE